MPNNFGGLQSDPRYDPRYADKKSPVQRVAESAIKQLKAMVEARDIHVTSRNRRTANGIKTYVRVRGEGTKLKFDQEVKSLILEIFPEAYITSGSYVDGCFDLTLALWE